ncbi:reverse transcriptase domain-containing protein, partial [Tanacetum coccineum]
MTPIYKYLAKKARALKRKSWRFVVINGILYKKSFLGLWQRFGLPGEIISDNGKQFRDDPFKDWCKKLCINQHFASIKHLQTNGLVERANRSLGEGIKARLEARSKNWMEELPYVLWAHRIMIKSSNGDTPFSLTYGTKAVIPAEIGMPTIRTAEVDLVQNIEALEINLDLLEERREEAAIREAKRDLLYHNNDASRAEDTWKLGPKWEGPYEVCVFILNLVDQVHGLETSSTKLQEKVTVYENYMGQLERFQDERIKVVNDKFDKLYTNFVEMALHLEEKFYPYLLTTVSGRRWLLTHGMELVISKCLNSTEYLSTLGAVIGKAVEKGMQDGLSARITHGVKGRALTNVAAYNPSAEADYLSTLQRIQSVNFSLITEFKTKKDPSIETIMNLLRLEDTLAEKL